ncbi:Xanthine/uracil permease [Halobacillus karajensis]|uniref:Purine permease YwdJ n=1 Tax=Halobacillus karajensis TaxID=195088 RepID=A0A059NZE6_9BACI|nr:Putative purine permease YwdJ [Halobacillus karajensis]CDQ23562.1 Putative purine permease YwdJ [Halobacillus karajensis]CDQ27044.1 Putative purine permease YwdJ [Halobacillus karajensis]SEH52480.1 Xanthine/uracil permease [Halobacillus karajensis]
MDLSLEAVQWFVFLLANAVALPIVIGSIFDLPFNEIAGLMQRTFFVVGVTSFLQGLFGHRLPIMEGPAGIWISIFAVMAYSGAQSGETYTETLQALEGTMIWTGIFLFIFGISGLSHRVLYVFTPLVTGAFLFLLTVQLSGTFLQGMLGIQQQVDSVDGIQAFVAFLTLGLIIGLSIIGKGWLKSFGVLIGIGVGWIVYTIVFIGERLPSGGTAAFSLPEIFAWGPPQLTWGTLPLGFLTAVILLSNLVASIIAVSHTIYGQPQYTYDQVNKGSSFLGINHGITAVFSAVANVSMASSSGFMKLTGQKKKQPFLYASLLLVVFSFFPPIVGFISGIPAPVANAALLATFIQLMGLGLSNIASQPLDERRLTILGLSFLLGIGLMFLPPEAFNGAPPILQNLLSNGLLVGTVLIIILDQLWKESNKSS